MESEGFKRKLSAILSADVVGYSRLMGENEEQTILSINTYRKLIGSLTDKHHGRVVDSPGDNLLAEFTSVIDAVRCAVEIQEEISERNAKILESQKMEYRIGINIGDVVDEEGRIYGDGVNIAARLESLAEPGGICISGLVYSHVKNKLKLEYEYLGKQAVKNIREPVPIYRILSLPKTFLQSSIEEEQAISLSNKPSIAVLPFVNMSNDPEQEYFSDGMSEELISALAKLEGLKVISHTSSFYFKGEHIDLCTVGEKLKVDYVVEGSVRKAGNRLRITSQLIKVADDTHLWSETYNREIDDVFAIQEEISNAIVDKLKIRILGKEKEPIVKIYTENLDAYESFIKGRYFYYSFKKGGMEKALQYYKQAVTLDPNYAPAYSAIAEWYWLISLAGQEVARENIYANAREAINKALEIDNNLSEAHANLGFIRWSHECDWKGAEKSFKTAINLNPGSSKSHADYAFYLAAGKGNPDKSIPEARKAIELDPLSSNAHVVLGFSLFAAGQFDQSIEELRYALEMAPNLIASYWLIGWAYARKGQFEEATREINKGLELFPKHPTLLRTMGFIYGLKEEKEKIREILNELLQSSKKEYVSSVDIALLYAYLGELDQTFEFLEKSYEKRDIWLSQIKILIPPSHILYTDPRFITFLKKMGLEE